MTENELNKKLAEWVGWHLEDVPAYPIGTTTPRWVDPTGVNHFNPSDFTSSLDACFKWLVPPLEDKGLTLDYISFRQASGRYYAEFKIYREKDQIKCGELLAKDWQEGMDLGKITALALCKAVEQLVDAK